MHCFTEKHSYRYIFDDPTADFEYFSFEYETNGLSIVIPMGVYGVSMTHKIYFPLQLNSFGRAFIMLSFEGFKEVCEIEDQDEARQKYEKILQVREEFIKRIFLYYYNLSGTFNSIMAWTARGPNSPTRRVAESINFNRMEIGETGSRTEIYFKEGFHEREFDYLAECGSRWDTIFAEMQIKSRLENNINGSGPSDKGKQLLLFYKVIVNY